MKKHFQTYNRPKNCNALVVPLVNHEIWTQLPANARKNDLNLSHTQRALVKAEVAVLHTANSQLEGTRAAQTGQEVCYCTDAIALIGHVNRELTLRRRAAIVHEQKHGEDLRGFGAYHRNAVW